MVMQICYVLRFNMLHESNFNLRLIIHADISFILSIHQMYMT